MIAAAIIVVFPFAMIYAALSDLFTMTIANRISGLLIVTFLIIAPFIGLSTYEFGMHILAFAVVLAVCFGLFATGTLGGGDAKLLASTALWMGFNEHLISYLFVSAMAGGALSVVLLILRRSMFSVWVGEVAVLRRVVDEKDIPYGIALAIGGLAAFPATPAMQYALAALAA